MSGGPIDSALPAAESLPSPHSPSRQIFVETYLRHVLHMPACESLPAATIQPPRQPQNRLASSLPQTHPVFPPPNLISLTPAVQRTGKYPVTADSERDCRRTLIHENPPEAFLTLLVPLVPRALK